MPTNDEIFEKVQATLVDALGVDEDDVTPGATLQGDLAQNPSTFWTSSFVWSATSESRFRAASSFRRISRLTRSGSPTGNSQPRASPSSGLAFRSQTWRNWSLIRASRRSATFTRSRCLSIMCRASWLLDAGRPQWPALRLVHGDRLVIGLRKGIGNSPARVVGLVQAG